MAYYRNRTTGEYVEYWKDPNKSETIEGTTWEPADQAYVDKMEQQKKLEKEQKRQQEREVGGIAELKKAIALFDKDYGKGMEARARASASSAAVASGLGGTTRPGAVSAGTMAEWEDIRRGRLAGAQSALANFLGSYRDPYATTPQTVLGQQQLGLGQRQLTQQGRQAGQQLGFNYAQLGQQQSQFAGELGLGYAQLNARNNQPAPAPSLGSSIWEPLNTGGGGSGSSFSYPSHDVPIQWGENAIPTMTDEEAYQGGWTG